jgi:hypothetical protein
MSEFNVIQSATWPFAEYHQDIPQGLFVDAHVVSADSCRLSAVTVVSGSVFVSLTVVKDNVETEVSSGSVDLDRNSKVKFYNAVGKCFGWLLTGDVLPDNLIVQNVSYELAGDVCIPMDGYVPANSTGMTGDWEIVGEDGITVDPEYDEDTGELTLSFGTDESWYTVEDPNYTQKSEGEGIWTVNGVSMTALRIRIDDGAVFGDLEDEHETLVRGLTLVPDLVLFSDTPDGSDKKHMVFNVAPSPSTASVDYSWNGPDGWKVNCVGDSFTVFNQSSGLSYEMKLNETVLHRVNYRTRLERLAIRWAGCPDNDPFRDIVKTSAEAASNVPFPLDPILEGSE